MTKAIILFAALTAGVAQAQTCDQAKRNYAVSNGANVRNQEMVDRAYQDMQLACGGAAPQQYQAPPPPAYPAQRQGPGQFVGCDQAGCWGANNRVRYTFVAGGNLAGSDGSFCVRGAGNTFSCN